MAEQRFMATMVSVRSSHWATVSEQEKEVLRSSQEVLRRFSGGSQEVLRKLSGSSHEVLRTFP